MNANTVSNMAKRYRLYYDTLELGEVTEEYSDFPNSWGAFRANGAIEDSGVDRKIQDYIVYSIAADRLMQSGAEAEWERLVAANESRFLNLIESNLWYLLEGEKREAIMIPNFCQDDQIVWRWNFVPGEQD